MNRKRIIILIAVVVLAGIGTAAYAIANARADDKAASAAGRQQPKTEAVSDEVKEAKAQSGGGASTVNRDDDAGEPVDPSAYRTNTEQVAIIDYKFSPEMLTIKKGTTVTWENRDYAEHTVTSATADGPKSDKLAQNQLFSYKFTKAGTYYYFSDDELRPKATIVVTD